MNFYSEKRIFSSKSLLNFPTLIVNISLSWHNRVGVDAKRYNISWIKTKNIRRESLVDCAAPLRKRLDCCAYLDKTGFPRRQDVVNDKGDTTMSQSIAIFF